MEKRNSLKASLLFLGSVAAMIILLVMNSCTVRTCPTYAGVKKAKIHYSTVHKNKKHF